ncbi:Activating transcription factor 6 [Balamuthia mandrillaris]
MGGDEASHAMLVAVMEEQQQEVDVDSLETLLGGGNPLSSSQQDLLYGFSCHHNPNSTQHFQLEEEEEDRSLSLLQELLAPSSAASVTAVEGGLEDMFSDHNTVGQASSLPYYQQHNNGAAAAATTTWDCGSWLNLSEGGSYEGCLEVPPIVVTSSSSSPCSTSSASSEGEEESSEGGTSFPTSPASFVEEHSSFLGVGSSNFAAAAAAAAAEESSPDGSPQYLSQALFTVEHNPADFTSVAPSSCPVIDLTSSGTLQEEEEEAATKGQPFPFVQPSQGTAVAASSAARSLSSPLSSSSDASANERTKAMEEEEGSESNNTRKRKRTRKTASAPPLQTAVSLPRKELLKLSSAELEEYAANLRKIRPLTPLEEKDIRRQRRLIKNRESASLSRKRKRMHLEEMEDKVNLLTEEKETLKEQVDQLSNQNQELQQQVHRLQGLLQNVSYLTSALKKATSISSANIKPEPIDVETSVTAVEAVPSSTRPDNKPLRSSGTAAVRGTFLLVLLLSFGLFFNPMMSFMWPTSSTSSMTLGSALFPSTLMMLRDQQQYQQYLLPTLSSGAEVRPPANMLQSFSPPSPSSSSLHHESIAEEEALQHPPVDAFAFRTTRSLCSINDYPQQNDVIVVGEEAKKQQQVFAQMDNQQHMQKQLNQTTMHSTKAKHSTSTFNPSQQPQPMDTVLLPHQQGKGSLPLSSVASADKQQVLMMHVAETPGLMSVSANPDNDTFASSSSSFLL